MSNVNIKGGVELQQFLNQLPAKMEANIMRAALRQGANAIAAEAKQNVPVHDGDLKASIRVSTRNKNGVVSASVKAGGGKAWYARFAEFGTAAHLIKVNEEEKPINYRLSVKRGKTVRASMGTINRNVLQIGNNFVGPTIEHPGAKAKPFMRPALDLKAKDAVEAIGQYIKKRLTKQGLDAGGVEVGASDE